MPLYTNYIIELPRVERGVVLGLSSSYISKLGVLFILNTYVALIDTYGPFGWRGEGEGVEGSRVELAKNKLILG